MNYGICITARMNSKRLFGKALLPICKQPALYWLCKQLRPTGLPIVICTSTNILDDSIADFSFKNGVNCFRGSEHDVLSRIISAAEEYSFNAIIRITGDDLFIDPETVIQAIDQHDGSDYVYTNLPKGADFQIILLNFAKKLQKQWENKDTEYLTWMLNTAEKQQFIRFMEHDYNLAFELDNESDLTKVVEVISHFYRHQFVRISDLLKWAKDKGFPVKSTIDRRCDYAS